MEIVRIYDQEGSFCYAMVLDVKAGVYVIQDQSGTIWHLSQRDFFEKTQEKALFMSPSYI